MPITAALSAADAGKINALLADIEQQFTLDEEALVSITEHFHELFNVGLSEYGHPMAMIPTFVTGVPNGTETGTFLALDLGGTNLRVCQVELFGDKTFSLKQQKYRVSEALKTGEATVLFDYLADSVDAFLTSSAGSPTNPHRPGDLDYDPPALPLGLTFSFPVEQTALDKGILLTWTKGFAAKNAVNKDVVGLLQDAFDRKHLHVKCVALVNDTVGAALSRAYTTGGCVLGAIFGTGTNGAYLEQVSNITKLGNGAAAEAGGVMMVNTEWGGFDNARLALPTTPFDNKLDRESINPRFQAYEKFISGMYLGEITRNVLLALVDAAPHPILFGGRATERLNKHYGLDTEMLSLIESAWTASDDGAPVDDAADAPLRDFSAPADADAEAALPAATRRRLEAVRSVVEEHLGFEPGEVSLRDAALVRWAAALVVRRAARLSACAVATVARQMGYVGAFGRGERAAESATGMPYSIGIDGSLYQHYPRFEERLRESLRLLVGEEVELHVEMGLAKDGSGVGAALCALQATKQNKL